MNSLLRALKSRLNREIRSADIMVYNVTRYTMDPVTPGEIV